MEFNIGDRVKLRNSKSNQIGEIIGVLEVDIIYSNKNNEQIIHARKGELAVKFPFHESISSFSFYSKSNLIKNE